MKMTTVDMLALSEAASKGVKPWYSKEGEALLAKFIQGQFPATKREEETA